MFSFNDEQEYENSEESAEQYEETEAYVEQPEEAEYAEQYEEPEQVEYTEQYEEVEEYTESLVCSTEEELANAEILDNDVDEQEAEEIEVSVEIEVTEQEPQYSEPESQLLEDPETPDRESKQSEDEEEELKKSNTAKAEDEPETPKAEEEQEEGSSILGMILGIILFPIGLVLFLSMPLRYVDSLSAPPPDLTDLTATAPPTLLGALAAAFIGYVLAAWGYRLFRGRQNPLLLSSTTFSLGGLIFIAVGLSAGEPAGMSVSFGLAALLIFFAFVRRNKDKLQ
ncbi:hypothetical protein [Candidatus Albibeggiatoa sp. nov. NOAA]|uniref:hypothetical protein n=1 Tax=Candidatus Albibeggiatoa sp. nov. NOAA TaxID=3162724 RepID=UPI003302725E|nr:hypothetical protein [Thiotrichaceae bacterium]